ncbi:unnamed protein product [marine sediment metagenome]|uniref:Uncharacterized protein n=1 Tax=marine sediment metagenome TaxID=412755 RepID=X1DZ26_9ZZZZ
MEQISVPLIISDHSLFENEFGAIRLKKVRRQFGSLPTASDIPLIEDLFVQWYTFDEIMPIRCTYRVSDKGTNHYHTITELSIHKSIKRCNDAYVEAVQGTMNQFLDQEPRVFFDREWGVKKTNALSIVLEYDATKYTLGEAWLCVGIDFNRFLSNIKKHFGSISHIRAWQSHDSGMPHIHVIIYFKTFEFSVVEWYDKKAERMSYRIHSKQKVKPNGKYCRQAIKEAWTQGFVDIKAIDNMGDTFKDLLKYVTRDLDGGAYTLTNAMAWYFRKQSFGISRDFKKVVWGVSDSIGWVEPNDADAISTIRSNSNRELIAIEVFPLFPSYFFYKPCVTLYNWDKPPPYLCPNIWNFFDHFVATKCDANVKVRDDGVSVTTYKIRGGEVI